MQMQHGLGDDAPQGLETIERAEKQWRDIDMKPRHSMIDMKTYSMGVGQ